MIKKSFWIHPFFDFFFKNIYVNYSDLVISEEFKNQIVNEVKDVGNISLVGRKHGKSTSKIFTSISKLKSKDKIF